MVVRSIARLAGIEYAGVAGCTKDCVQAVVKKLQHGDPIEKAKILTHERNHCFLLIDSIGDKTAVKSGFTSGYRGEGPRGLSCALQILKTFGVEIEEIKVDERIIEKVDYSCLSAVDVDRLEGMRPIRPSKWHDYIFYDEQQEREYRFLSENFPIAVPFAIIDSRIIDLAVRFRNDPDGVLISAYRRLEDIVRERTSLDAFGSKLFSDAFHGKKSKLVWKEIDENEQTGRANLFTGVFMAFRNPRAHRELKSDQRAQLSEFLLLNQLYFFETGSVPRDADCVASNS